VSTEDDGHPIEWACALSPDPAADGKGLDRGFVVVWFRDGGILDVGLLEPTLTQETLAASYLAATRDPKAGEPHVPDRVRVSSPEVAGMLRATAGPGVEVVVAPTPELEALDEKIKQDERRRVRDDGTGETYLGPHVSIGMASRFFVFVAGLYRAAPWEHVPFDDCLIGITCEELGLDGAVVSVMGQDGTGKGFLLFPSMKAFDDYMALDFDVEGPVPFPPHWSLTFERGADLAPRRRKEVAAHGFEVADAHAYPQLVVLEAGGVLPKPPDNRDLELVGAVASGLEGLVKTVPDLGERWRGKGAMVTFRIQTTKGKVEMTLSAPHDAAEAMQQGRAKVVRVWEKKKG
jgi:hypothetical protein